MSIAGVDSGGGAGVAADIKTFAAFGVHGTCVITSVTAQNTKGVLGSFDLPVQFIEEQFNAVIDDIKVDCAKTGMLSSPDIVRAVAEMVKKQKLPLVIDPVMAAEAGGKLLRDEAVRVLIEELLPLAEVVTPNVFEAERLSGLGIKDADDARKAARKIHDLGAKAVIVTGGHLEGTDVLYDGDFTLIEGKLVKGGTHGSGCTHSAAITAELARGTPLILAARHAKEFVEQAILASVKIGGGAAPVNQVGQMLAGSERYHVLSNVKEAVELIEKNKLFSGLIPEVGCNIAMGVQGVSSIKDVAAVSGRIVRLKGSPHAVGCVEFGASSHIARIVLTAMQYDGSIRAAMNIRYSEDALSACRELGLKIASFSRKDEPEDVVSTMEWGVADAIKNAGCIPDVVYDKGDVGKEAMIRLLGRNAVQVAGMALQIIALQSSNW